MLYQTRHSWVPTGEQNRAGILSKAMPPKAWKADSKRVRSKKGARLQHGELRHPPGFALNPQTCERLLGAIIPQGKGVTVCG